MNYNQDKIKNTYQDLRIYFFRILNFLVNFLRGLSTILLSGIRAKLALFTGSLIFLTVLVLTFITVNQQTEMLTNSYNKEVALSRNYISNLVLSLDSITKNMIRIEEFRDQVTKRSEELKKYRSTRIVEVDKKVSFFGVKTNLFGTLGKEKVKRRQDTFYSRYLSKDDIAKLESKIQFELEQLSGRSIESKEWENLQAISKRYVTTALKENTDPSILIGIRSELENRIFSLMISKNRAIIETIGLDTDRFRIQTFPIATIASIAEGKTILPSFDSSVFNSESPLATLDVSESMNKSLVNSLGDLSENPTLPLAENTYSFRENDLDIEIFYSPLFKNPHSTARSQALLRSANDMKSMNKILEEDRRISLEIAGLIPKIRDRLKKLRDSNPPQPPYKDKEFNKLYKDYFTLLQTRNDAVQGYIDQYKPNSNLTLAYDSVRYLRESYWEDLILYRYSYSDFDINRFQDSDYLNQYSSRWTSLRDWVRSAREETVPKELASRFPDGTIGKSRSEAEELMWEIDSTPLLSEEDIYSARIILSNNLTGVIRTFVDKTDGVRTVRSNRNTAILSAIGVSILSVLLAIFVSGMTVEKIKRIISNAEEVGEGRLDVEFEHGGNDEFGNLTVALNNMVTGLREREKIKGIMGSMIDPVVVGEAMKDLSALRRGSEREITAFFSDIAGFTTISEKLSSSELAELLNTYLSEMTIILKNYGGVLDKYIGDAIVGIFNSPLDVANHPVQAVRASLDMIKKLEDLKQVWRSKNQYIPEVHSMNFRIGLNTGIAKVGLMGTHSISSYTMMGDTVNLAARLESAGKDYGVKILISEQVKRELGDRFLIRRLDRVQVKGKSEPVTLYEPIASEEEATDSQRVATQSYEKGFESYLRRDWKNAIQAFERCIPESVGIFSDTSARMLISRCQEYLQNPPPEDWKGIFVRKSK